MPIVDDKQVRSGMLFGAYGIPGSGKTLLAAGFMKLLYDMTGKPCLYGDWEGGVMSIPAGIPYTLWVPGDGDPEDEAHDLATAALSDDFSGLVVDTISSMGESILDAVAKRNIYAATGSEQKHVGYKTRGGINVPVPSLADYRTAQTAFQQWSRHLPNLFRKGKHVLWVAHEQVAEVSDSSGKKDMIGGPEIIGAKLTRTAPKIPHIMARVTCQKKGIGDRARLERFIQTEIDGLYVSKDRINALPRGGCHFNVDPHLEGDQLVNAIIDRAYKVWETVFRSKGYTPGKE